jgi:membrane fusion protein, heavy metal efflux system
MSTLSSLHLPAVVGVALIALTVGTGCGPASPEKQPSASAGKESFDPLSIRAEPGLFERLRIEEPTWAEVGLKVTVPAHVSVDESRVTRVGSPVLGRVVELPVQVGLEVKQGQELVVLNSTALSDAQLAFLRSFSRRQAEERAVQRAKSLLEAGVIGAVELSRREAEFAQATAEMDVARDQLGLLGMSREAIIRLEQTRQIDSISRVLAGMNGTVTERRVSVGQVVQASESLFDIVDLSRVWLVADVPELKGGSLFVGQPVRVRVPALPDLGIEGRLTFVSSTVNPATHTIQVRLDVNNPDRRLKPAMLATLEFTNHAERKMVIPLSAVVREDNHEHVFVQKEPQVFILRKVSVGHEADGNRVSVEGLRDGEKIVTEGAFHLNNERSRRALKGTEGS